MDGYQQRDISAQTSEERMIDELGDVLSVLSMWQESWRLIQSHGKGIKNSPIEF